MGRSRQGADSAHALSGVRGCMALGSRYEAGLLYPAIEQLTKKSGFGKIHGVSFLRGTKREGTGGETISQGLFWESYNKLTFACDSVYC